MSKKGKHFKEKERKSAKYFFLNIILIFFLVAIIFSIYNIWEWIADNKETETMLNEISNAIIIEDNDNNVDQNGNSKYNVDFGKLKKTNPNTVAWIKVNGTSIEYPVVKHINNDFYLIHSFDKSENSAGWVFADFRNKMDGTDKNIIVYGHNRRDGSMFATLKNVLNKNWYENEENQQIIFITENGNNKYQVFAVYQIQKEDYDISTSFSDNKQFLNYVNNAKKRSVYDFNVSVNENDKILTLSTCANDNRYRVVVHAKLL